LVREEERLHLARELHDELGQMLTAIHLNLTRIKARAAIHDEVLVGQLADLSDQIVESTRTVRRIARELRPQGLVDRDLFAAIEFDAGELRKQLGIRCRVTRPDEPVELPEKLSNHIYRICQEALTNIARHAQATRVDISVTCSATDLELVVADDGKGIPPGAWTGNTLGLVGMQERAQELVGTLEMLTRPAHAGTRISLRVKRPVIAALEHSP
jgi:signal transduction histidine kinase